MSTMLGVLLWIIIWNLSDSIANNFTCSDITCQHININCNNNEDCYVICVDTSCYKSTIRCPQSSNICSIQCYSDQGRACEEINIDASGSPGGTLIVSASQYDNIMQNGTITCPPNGICNITCSQTSGCQYLRIIGSYGSILTLNAADAAFTDGYVSCPDHGQCNINCNKVDSCTRSEIDGRIGQYSNITLNAIDNTAFYNSTVYGSAYGYMDIQCTGYRSCRHSVIRAHDLTKYLNVYGDQEGCLEFSDIYCPNNGANKEIICYIDAGGNANVANANFYAAEAFRDVTIICRNSCGYTEQWSGPWIWCGTNYTHQCKLSGPDQSPWECTSGICSTFQYTYSPTTLPTTSIPTNNPTTFPPTKIPSNIPTNIPSNIPTNIPSNQPTNTPSNTPTNMPTNYPSDTGTTRSGLSSAEKIEPETTKTIQEESSDGMILERMGMPTMTLLIIVFVIIMICFIIICIIKYFRKRNERELSKNLSVIKQNQQDTIAIVQISSRKKISNSINNDESSSDSDDLFNTGHKTKGEGNIHDMNGKMGERHLSKVTSVTSEHIEELFTDDNGNNDDNGMTTKGTSMGGNDMENNIKDDEDSDNGKDENMENMYQSQQSKTVGRMTSKAADV